MVLRCLPSTKRARNLRTGQELLDNDTRTGTAECTAVDRVLDCLDGFFLGHSNGNALAECKTIRLTTIGAPFFLMYSIASAEFSKTA